MRPVEAGAGGASADCDQEDGEVNTSTPKFRTGCVEGSRETGTIILSLVSQKTLCGASVAQFLLLDRS